MREEISLFRLTITQLHKVSMLRLACCLYLVAANVKAQVTLLTTREAERILDVVPNVAESRVRGGCPTYTVADETSVELSVQVREACPPAGFASNLLDNYVINRITGAVFEGLDSDSADARVSTPAINSITAALVRQAHGRALGSEEAECLVVEAARSELGVREPEGALSVSKAPAGPGEWRFLVDRRIPRPPAMAARSYTVRADTATVRDDETGNRLMSQGLETLASRILSTRQPPTILPDDALIIALALPSLAASVADGCSELVSVGYGPSDEIYIGRRALCPGAPNGVNLVASVSAATGHLTDPRTGESLGSPEAERIAGQILRRHQERFDRDKATVAAACNLKNGR